MNKLNKLFGAGRSNAIKIICLAFGITAGLLLLAKVHFESSFDTFYPDSERIWQLREAFTAKGETSEFGQVSGAVAAYMAEKIPQVEAATRMTLLFDADTKYVLGDGNKLQMSMSLADSLWFDVFQQPIVVGDPHAVLARPMSAMISRSMAEKMGGVEQAIGQTFYPSKYEEWKMTVGGVFEDYPANSSFEFDVIASIYAMPQWSLENWIGNDRYIAYAKLHNGADVGQVEDQIRLLQEEYSDLAQLEAMGMDMRYNLVSLYATHRDAPEVRNLNNLMLIVAFVLIAIAVLNYILIVLSTLIGRAKEIAVRKCYGSSRWDIVKIVFSEASANLLAALALGGALAFVLRHVIERMLGVEYSAMFTWQAIGLLAVILAVVLALTVAVPAWFFVRIPISAAFRAVAQTQSLWKKCLLFVEFAGTAFVAVLLANIARQYDYMVSADMGYNVENLMCCDARALNQSQCKAVVAELDKLPEVESATLACTLPLARQSGNNIIVPGDNETQLNVTDMYFVSDNYFKTMGIKVVEGPAFDHQTQNGRSMVVNRAFVDKMRQLHGWQTSPIGWQVLVSEHSESPNDLYTVVGVIDDIMVGTAKQSDDRPIVFFCDSPDNSLYQPSIILIRVRDLSTETMAKVNRVITSVAPDKELIAESYRLLINSRYVEDKNLRDSIVACCIIALVISLTGLIGYVSDEVNRRRREIAVRKVNGATVADILRMLLRGITVTALIALVLGAIGGWFCTALWLENYNHHVALSVPVAVGCIAAVYAIIAVCIVVRAYKAAIENPVVPLHQN